MTKPVAWKYERGGVVEYHTGRSVKGFHEDWEETPLYDLQAALSASHINERKAIVDWLRSRWSDGDGTSHDLWLADAIESGVHLKRDGHHG